MPYRIYDETRNPEGTFLTGVPLRDLTEEEYASYPEWLQQTVDACPFYRVPAPPKPAREKSQAAAPTDPTPSAT